MEFIKLIIQHLELPQVAICKIPLPALVNRWLVVLGMRLVLPLQPKLRLVTTLIEIVHHLPFGFFLLLSLLTFLKGALGCTVKIGRVFSL